MKKNTLLEDVNRQRTLMGLDPVTEKPMLKEGWGTNLAVGTGLFLSTFLPSNMLKAQDTPAEPDGSQSEQTSTTQPINAQRMKQILSTLISQGWIGENENLNELIKKIPEGSMWTVVDYSSPTYTTTQRGLNNLLNAVTSEPSASGNIANQMNGGMFDGSGKESAREQMPKFRVYKRVAARPNMSGQTTIPEKWEGIGFIMVERGGSTYQTQSSDFSQAAPSTTPQ